MSDSEPADGEDAVLLERPVDRVNAAFFRDIVDEYVEHDRLQRGYARLELDDEDRERRLVVEDDIPELSDTAYTEAQLAETIDVLGRDDAPVEGAIELPIPVGDPERVRDEVEEDGTVTVFFEPEGVRALLEELLAVLRAENDEPPAGDA
jgi:hypothetical protein